MKKFFVRLRSIERGTIADVLLLAAAAGCFGGFFYGQIHAKRLSGISGTALAVVTEGIPERRPANTPTFLLAPPGASFYNMDSAWTGKLVKASFKLDDGTMIELSERTLVTFKRPFKRGKAGTAAQEQVKVVKGTAKQTETQQEIKPTGGDESFPELPNPKASLAPEAQREKINVQPGPARILYMKATGEALVKFAWPEDFNGYLVIRNRETGKVTYISISGVQFADVPLAQDATYYWQLIGSDRKLVNGPFRFELRTLTAGAAKQIMEQSKRGLVQPIDVYW